jgi:hypothetical protein
MKACPVHCLMGLFCALTLVGCATSKIKEAAPAPQPTRINTTATETRINTTEEFQEQMADVLKKLSRLGNSIVGIRDEMVSCSCGGTVRPLGFPPPPKITERAAIASALQTIQLMAKASDAGKSVNVKAAAAE